MTSNMMENSLAMISVTSLRTLACIPPDPFLHSTHLGGVEGDVPIENWGKILLCTSSSSSFIVRGLPFFFFWEGQGKGVMVPSLTFLFSLAYLPFWVFFYILCQIQSQLHLGLPHATPNNQTGPLPFPVHLTSIACAFPSCPLICLAGPYSAMLNSYLPCPIPCVVEDEGNEQKNKKSRSKWQNYAEKWSELGS